MKRLGVLLCAAVLILTDCDNALTDFYTDSQETFNQLSISVLTDSYQTKSVNFANALPNESSVGLFMKNVDPADLYQHDLKNLKYTAKKAGEGQVWEPEHEVYLNNELCSIYAYYPYSETATDVTAIPVTTTGQTDYMYAGNTIEVNTANHTATLEMEHALSVITLKVQRGSYTGTGAVTKVGLNGLGIAQSALMDAETGKLHDYAGVNDLISQNVDLTMNETVEYVHTLVVPNGETAPVRITLWVDGNEYYVVAPGVQFEQGARYEYTLTVDQDEMGVSNVHVGDWGYNGLGNPVLWIGNHSVTLAGDINRIALFNEVVDGVLTISAINLDEYLVNEVTYSGTATLTQSFERITRTISLANIESDVTIQFYGIDRNPPAIADDWSDLSDGVYLVRTDLRPANISEFANRNPYAVGVGLVNGVTGQRLLIEKYEHANNPESITVYTNAAQMLGASYTDKFSWGGYGTTAGTFVSSEVGAGSTGLNGHLPKSDNSYAGSPYLDGSPTTWIANSGALSDFGGISNSLFIKEIVDNGSEMSSTNAPMSYLLNTFNDKNCPVSVNLGYKDWQIPSCGQLGLIWLNLTELNEALSAIQGTPFTPTIYWASSERGTGHGWGINMSTGFVNGEFKYWIARVRLVRNL